MTPTVTPTHIPSYYPTPTTIAGDPEPEEMFSCDFNEEGIEQKPYRISNIVCTSEPEWLLFFKLFIIIYG